MLPKVLIDRGMSPKEEELLGRCAEIVRVGGDRPLSEPELIQALQGCRGLIKEGPRLPDLTRAVLEGAPDLKIVSVQDDRFCSAIDMDAAEACGVKIVDTSNISSHNPVAEWVLAMIFMVLRNTGTLFRQVMEGSERWAVTPNMNFVNGELTGRRVGLIGCGHIGQRVIELLEPFKVDLRVYDPYVSDELVARLGIVRGDLDEVLEHADILIVQVPHTPKTEKMIGERELDLLGKGRLLVNCSRGKVIDEAALIRKVEAGELIAGLDVFEEEPLPKEHPLRSMRNVFITPHVAWNAPEHQSLFFINIVEDFERFFKGEPLQHEVTRRMFDIRNGNI